MPSNYSFNIYERLKSRRTTLAVIGIGYVGRPVLESFAKHFNTIGYDIDSKLIDSLRGSIGKNAKLSASEESLDDASFFIVTVATPIDSRKLPDLTQLVEASRTVGRHLKRGDYVVFESTVYPGCTDTVCIPILEKTSGMIAGKDFKVGYSPERISPGDPSHTFANTEKIVSATDNEALAEIKKVYSSAISADIHSASSIKVAEASKIVENVQRAVNIALMNELHQLFCSIDIDLTEVLEMASTKWNFAKYRPGLVGGHCIPVDPYYLLSEASRLGIDIPVTQSGCAVNDNMVRYIAESICNGLSAQCGVSRTTKALIMGITYKADTDDIRNSQTAELFRILVNNSIETHVVDPYADSAKVFDFYGIKLNPEPEPPYDIIISTVGHKPYASLDDRYFRSIAFGPESILVDIGCTHKDKITSIRYWGI